ILVEFINIRIPLNGIMFSEKLIKLRIG
ncbi:hypothetical protein A2U01_0068885, partial [Trifolium medium]|nr:hypothetical protein [Trifolium medium]